jgi:hypothetical protein
LATTLSTGHNNAGANDISVEADMYKANKEFQNAPAHTRDYDMSFGRSGTLGKTMGGSNYNTGNPGSGGAGAGERVLRL